ncbi:MAG TPA: AMP-binding protein, partial [Candidatus Hydrogenedentes bacterium]|nr:AMP-binding protein [Candidatus Hydrogenedentota bacterium]
RMKGGVIAATNMLTFVGMAGSSLLYAFLGGIGVPPAGVFIALSIASLVMGAYIAMNLPLLLLRAVLWMMDGTLFRLIVRGRERLRENEPALRVANHDTLIDTLAIQAALDRDVYFVLDASGLEYRWVRRLGHFLRLIPVDTTSHQGLEAGVSAIRKALSDGHLVCVPREPILRREGLRVPWHDDYGLLTRGSQTLIHPVAMTRLWERVYIFRNNRIQWRWWGRPRYPVQVYLGEGMAADVPAWAIRKAQEHLYMEAYQERPYQYETLHEGFVSAARRNLHRIAMADSLTGALTYFKTLVGAVALARKLKPILGREENVGLLLPSTVGGALTNIAVQMMGKVPINLNYTASSEIIAGCARRADIRHVLTSRRFLERLPQLQVPEIPVYLEEIREQVTAFDRITSMLMALLLPRRLLLRVLGCGRKTEHSLATIIFSSGSEGEPKGVMLTHRNIMTIKEEAEDYFPHDRNSCVVGILPLFHSFGYTACVWTPLLAGVRVAYHPNPLEPRQIGQICQEHHGTIMVATATFLQGFIRRCDHAQLESLEYVVCGAEKLPER